MVRTREWVFDASETGFTTSHGQYYLYEDPARADLTVQQRTWLTGYLNQFEAVLYGPDRLAPAHDLEELVELVAERSIGVSAGPRLCRLLLVEPVVVAHAVRVRIGRPIP